MWGEHGLAAGIRDIRWQWYDFMILGGTLAVLVMLLSRLICTWIDRRR